MTLGMSQRSTMPSPLVSTISATSGVTMLPAQLAPAAWAAGSVHVHLTAGSNEFGGAGGAVHVGALPDGLPGATWHASILAASGLPPSFTRIGVLPSCPFGEPLSGPPSPPPPPPSP